MNEWKSIPVGFRKFEADVEVGGSLIKGDDVNLADFRKDIEVKIYSNSSNNGVIDIKHIPTGLNHREEGTSRRKTELKCVQELLVKVNNNAN